jgi:hypothetical protein
VIGVHAIISLLGFEGRVENRITGSMTGVRQLLGRGSELVAGTRRCSSLAVRWTMIEEPKRVR